MREFADVVAAFAHPTARRDSAVQGPPDKIQSICNGNGTASAMQGIEKARKNLPAQEQWEAMAKAMRRAMETAKSADVMQPKVKRARRHRASLRQQKTRR
jgi:hypothetical protein